MAKRVLNQKFDSIFDDNSFDEDEGITTLKLTDIEPNKSQPRKNFDIEALNTLADSIRLNGIIQPLLVRSMPDGTYQIVAGERRWRAAKMAGLTEVPVFIKELSDIQAQQIALIENLQRENLNPIEEANGYKELMDRFGMTQEDVARVVGKARSSVANSLRLLSLPPIIAEMVSNNELSAGHCKVLLGVKDNKDMVELAHRAAGKDVSVREMERMVKSLNKPEKPEKKKETFYVEAEISLSKALETNVSIIPGKKKSTIQIEFYNDEDLTDIINRLANNK
ncbi:MAG: ParB/RepB/Spo0J family partition protein [Ruminiclostridium sp.]